MDYTNISKIAAIVLAGGSGDSLSKTFGVSHKALVPIHNKPMAYYVLQALKKSRRVDFISYAGEADEAFLHLCDVVVLPGKGIAESLAAGKEAAGDRFDYFLILSADVPWLTPQAIDTFIEQSPQVDMIYTIIAKDVLEAAFPGQKRTYVKITEGLFTGGNVILLSQAALPKLLKVLNALHKLRKNPLKLARLFGFDMIIKLLLGRLRIPELEVRASKILGLQARAFIATDASLGADIDKLEHLQSVHIEKIGKWF